MNRMRLLLVGLMAMGLAGCGKTDAGTAPGPTPEVCATNSTILASDPACKPPATAVALLVRSMNSGPGAVAVPADTNFTMYVPNWAPLDAWNAAPEVSLRYGDGSARILVPSEYVWTIEDPSLVQYRSNPPGFQWLKNGQSYLTLAAGGLVGRIKLYAF